MQLYYFLVVVISLSCGSLPPGDVDPLRAIVASMGMVTSWWLLCHIGARAIAKQVLEDSLDPLVGANWIEKQLEAFRYLGLGVSVLCLGGFGLARVLDTAPVLEHSMFLQALALLSPAVLITIGTWSAEQYYGAKLGYTDRGARNYFRSLWLTFRGGMAWLVAPILILLGINDLASLAFDGSSQIIAMVSALAFVPFGLPWLIRHLFKTSKLDQDDQAWIASLMAAVGLKRTKSVRWETEGKSFNAMVAGFAPPLRTLLVSDRLLDELPREQVAMVVLHEAAHLKRRHVPIRMLSVLPAWGAGALISYVAGSATWAMGVGSVIGILLTMLTLRAVAYRTEYDADVVACKLAEKIGGSIDYVPATYDAAAETLASALHRVTEDHPAMQRASWLHPGVVERVDWMRRQRSAPTASNNNAGTIANPA